MTKKLEIQDTNRRKGTGYSAIFIEPDIHAQIKSLSESTGLSIKQLTEDFILFALKNLEILPASDGINLE